MRNPTAAEVVEHAATAIAGYMDEGLLPALRPISLAALGLNAAFRTIQMIERDGVEFPPDLLVGTAQRMGASGLEPILVNEPVTGLACAALEALEDPEGERQRYRDVVARAQHLILEE